MRLFRHENPQGTDRSSRLYARYELAHTCVDFAAAILFLVGSVLFFWDATIYVATWMFVLGSICFCLKPTLRLAREVHLYRLGDMRDLAARRGG